MGVKLDVRLDHLAQRGDEIIDLSRSGYADRIGDADTIHADLIHGDIDHHQVAQLAAK